MPLPITPYSQVVVRHASANALYWRGTAKTVRYDGLLNLSQSKGYRRLTHPTLMHHFSLATPLHLDPLRKFWIHLDWL